MVVHHRYRRREQSAIRLLPVDAAGRLIRLKRMHHPDDKVHRHLLRQWLPLLERMPILLLLLPVDRNRVEEEEVERKNLELPQRDNIQQRHRKADHRTTRHLRTIQSSQHLLITQ